MTNLEEKQRQRFAITGPESFFLSCAGVIATMPFSQGDVICDHHGRVIPQPEGERMMDKLDEGMCFLFFLEGTGGVKLCID